jgi:hypothetical protein
VDLPIRKEGNSSILGKTQNSEGEIPAKEGKDGTDDKEVEEAFWRGLPVFQVMSLFSFDSFLFLHHIPHLSLDPVGSFYKRYSGLATTLV